MSEKEDELEQQTIDLHFQQAMHKVKKSAVRLNPTGECLQCEEPLSETGQLFCDCYCRRLRKTNTSWKASIVLGKEHGNA